MNLVLFLEDFLFNILYMINDFILHRKVLHTDCFVVNLAYNYKNNLMHHEVNY